MALNDYAWTMLTAEPVDLRDPVKALEVAHRAVQLSVHLSEIEQAMILDTLAMAHHLTGDHPQAIVVAEQALALILESTGGEREAALRQEIEGHLSAFQVAQYASQKSAIQP